MGNEGEDLGKELRQSHLLQLEEGKRQLVVVVVVDGIHDKEKL